MISQEDKDFINRCFDTLYQSRDARANYLPAKKPPYDTEDGGVPSEMFASKISKSGWVKWKFLESNLDENDIESLENEYAINFPALFRAYLTARFQLFGDIRKGEYYLFLPSVPIDNPFGELRQYIDGWRYLIKYGFVPFGEFQDGWGAICFDTRNAVGQSDCPVVWFDHELVREQMNAEQIESLAKPVFGSFKELMTKMFLDEK
jgi:hypothetical protein